MRVREYIFKGYLSRKRQALKMLVLLFVFTGIISMSARNFLARRSNSGVALIIPGGTTVEIKMIDQLDTGETKTGDSFQASLARDLAINGKRIASKDGLVHGSVTDVVSSGRLRRQLETG